MQISPNPYKPGAGTPPLYLAGRRSDMDDAKVILASIAAGLPMRSVIYYGLRGVGKTVLLNKIEEEAKDLDIPAEFMEIEEKDGAFHRSVAFYVHKLIQRMSVKEKVSGYVRQALSILKAFSIKYSAQDISIEVQPANGISDTGDLQNDMTELFLALGKIAEKNEYNNTEYYYDEEEKLKEEKIHIEDLDKRENAMVIPQTGVVETITIIVIIIGLIIIAILSYIGYRKIK